MGRIREYDRRRRKRLLYIVPVALFLLATLLFTFERTRVADRIFSVGYEGPMRLLPEITILDDRGAEAKIFAEERRAMTSREVEIITEDEPDPKGPEPPLLTETRPEVDELPLDEFTGPDPVRSYASHAPVPLREDYVILRMFKPEYPSDAIERGLEGYVLVEVHVNERGLVEDAWVRKARGAESFEIASLTAVRQFEFRPIRERGEPIAFWISFLVRFELR